MTGYEYERYVASWLRNNGFNNVKVTKGSGDFGVDIIAYKNNCKCAVQCKHYSKGVGVKAIQEVSSGKMYYDCEIAVVVTNSYFTPNARELAELTNVILLEHIDFEVKNDKVYNEAARNNKIHNKSNLPQEEPLPQQPKEDPLLEQQTKEEKKLLGCFLPFILVYSIFASIIFKAVFETVKGQEIGYKISNILGGLFVSALPIMAYQLLCLIIYKEDDKSEFDNQSDLYNRKRNIFAVEVSIFVIIILILILKSIITT